MLSSLIMATRKLFDSGPASISPRPEIPFEDSSIHDAVSPSRLRFWHEIPPWQKDNEYILSGYRLVLCEHKTMA